MGTAGAVTQLHHDTDHNFYAQLHGEKTFLLYPPSATHEAVFQTTPRAIKFAKNSAFHYLNNGRYLMAQLLLHAFRQHVPPVVPGPSLLG